MKPNSSIRKLLSGGDLRSIARANEAVRLVSARPELFSSLLQDMWNMDQRICARAADSVEKVTRTQPELLEPFKAELLALAEKTTQKEVQWHLAQIMPRLSLTRSQWQPCVKILREYLTSQSAIVRTSALQALFELSVHSRNLRRTIAELIAEKSEKGSPAERARARKLLLSMKKDTRRGAAKRQPKR